MSDCTLYDCLLLALNNIIQPSINNVDGKFNYSIDAFFALTRAKDKFISIAGDNILFEIKSQISKITKETSNNSFKIFVIIFSGFIILFILLLFTTFGAINWRNTHHALLGFFILSILFIISISLIVYFWVKHLYDTSATTIDKYINNIDLILNNFKDALIPTICCAGCINCPIGNTCKCI